MVGPSAWTTYSCTNPGQTGQWDLAGIDFGQDLYAAWGLGYYSTIAWSAYAPGPLNHYTIGYPLDKEPGWPNSPDHSKPQMWASPIFGGNIPYQGTAGLFLTKPELHSVNTGGCFFS